MIDIHTHILANLDDGATEMNESLKMAKQAQLDGVTRLVCTPHIHQGYFDNSAEAISSAYKLFTQKLAESDCPLSIAYSAEVRICPEIIEWLDNDQLPLIGQWQGKKALLLELPHSHVPPGVENLIKWLTDNNYQPLIAHPERNRDMLSDYSKVKYLEDLGCLFQVTAGSFIGRFSTRIRKLANLMLSNNMITVIASDTHNLTRRPNDMKQCFNELVKKNEEKYIEKLMIENPYKLTQSLNWSV